VTVRSTRSAIGSGPLRPGQARRQRDADVLLRRPPPAGSGRGAVRTRTTRPVRLAVRLARERSAVRRGERQVAHHVADDDRVVERQLDDEPAVLAEAAWRTPVSVSGRSGRRR
jgi:hypothetical protein